MDVKIVSTNTYFQILPDLFLNYLCNIVAFLGLLSGTGIYRQGKG